MSIATLVCPASAGANHSLMANASNRQGRVTPETLEEARRLRAIYAAKKSALVKDGLGTQAAFGETFNIGNQAAVGFFLSGKTALSLKAAAGFARGLDCLIADFSPRLAALQTIYADGAGPLSPDVQELIRALAPEQKERLENAIRALLGTKAPTEKRAAASVSAELRAGTRKPTARQSAPR